MNVEKSGSSSQVVFSKHSYCLGCITDASACPANGQPALPKLNTAILEHKTVDRIDFKFLDRFSYILRRPMWFVFKKYQKKWYLQAKMTHFCAILSWKRTFVSYYISVALWCLTKTKILIDMSMLNLQHGVNRSPPVLVEITLLEKFGFSYYRKLF
jgi:hypothetical protein